MDDLKKSIVESLDGHQAGLFEYLPYLLQDLWEIGSSPEEVVKLIRNNKLDASPKKILDLGCGKGAISVKIARDLGFHVSGIDGMKEFIEDADRYAKEYGVDHLCKFRVDDIRSAIEHLSGYDVAILGSIGPVLGDIKTTLTRVKKCINKEGYIILDDGYRDDNSPQGNNDYPDRSTFLSYVEKSGCIVVDEMIAETNDIEESNSFIYDKIDNRAQELIRKHPEKKDLFESYLESQRIENSVLENDIKCVLFLIKPVK